MATDMIVKYSDEAILAALPHPEPRPGQIEAIRSTLESFDRGYKYVFLEAPTGSGKSAVALAVSRFYRTSYYLTIQKILQSQISRDYADPDDRSALIEVKGRNAYPCTFYERFGQDIINLGGLEQATLDRALRRQPSCGDGYCRRQGKSSCRHCFAPKNSGGEITDPGWMQRMGVEYSTCPYYEQVLKAMAGDRVLMNFSSFLFQTSYTKRFRQRDLMILDESHHVEEQLMGFVSFSFSDKLIADRGLTLPEFEEPAEYAIWFHENGISEIIGSLISSARVTGQIREEDELLSLRSRLALFMQCISDGMDQWVTEYAVHCPPGVAPWRSITLKPIYVRHFAKKLLLDYGTKCLFMSATILDARVMARALGIKKQEMVFHRLPNSFPVNNRPIFIIPAVRATGGKAKQGDWGPPMVKWVDALVRKYAGYRGIIHTHNFSIARMLLERCETKSRFLFQDAFRGKEEMLAEHASRSDGMIVAPAMHEGLDLHDDLSRLQIICKTPYPNHFEDKQLARRIEEDQRYLTWLVSIKLIQAYGRSVRSSDDWADTYIIDGTVLRLLAQAHDMIPSWFTEAIIRVPMKDGLSSAAPDRSRK